MFLPFFTFNPLKGKRHKSGSSELICNNIILLDLRKQIHFKEKRDYLSSNMGHPEMLSILEEFYVSAQTQGMWMVKKAGSSGSSQRSLAFRFQMHLKWVYSSLKFESYNFYCKLKACPVSWSIYSVYG